VTKLAGTTREDLRILNVFCQCFLIMETDCVLCGVRSKTQETVNDQKITTETVSVLCEVRSGDEYTADDLSKPIEQA
jgi:hypothetical protein